MELPPLDYDALTEQLLAEFRRFARDGLQGEAATLVLALHMIEQSRGIRAELERIAAALEAR